MEKNASKVRQDFAESLNLVAYGKSRIVLTRHGRRVAALVPIEILELFEQMEDKADAEAARKALAARKRIPYSQVRKKLGL
ncbi:MAG: type II toxin-antitoxin system prevent-host-death family antitoxin [Planctomycetes bacterium]|nr:type II toxin-antitoxin system prevent-host-death family antitoxin [Planctomycetota bacterium]